MKHRIILDLCGGTGSWSQPYVEAGYDVRVVTLPEQDVRMFECPGYVHGVLAAPPCTYFCNMRNCRGVPTTEQLREGLSVVDACLRVIVTTRPNWWALENPQGRLHRWLGSPVMKFQPYEFGDAWTKRTWLWGNFAPPILQMSVEPRGGFVNSGWSAKTRAAKSHTAEARSVTPPGFARAFFEANP